MKYIIVDLEMNPLPKRYKEERERCKNEIIQIGAVCLDEGYSEIDSFKTYVCPGINPQISTHIQDLTHITTEMVQGAPRFKKAVRMFFDWCRSLDDDIQIMQWSESDYRQIRKEMELINYDLRPEDRLFMEVPWRDLQQEYDQKIGKERRTSLSTALMLMGCDFKGNQHNALYDTRNEAEVLRILRDQDLCQKLLGKVMEALHETPFAFTIADAIDLNALGLSV